MARVRNKIKIFRDGVYAGTGMIGIDGTVSDCDAMLGNSSEQSDLTYEMIEEALEENEDSVTRPDGVYTWTIE